MVEAIRKLGPYRLVSKIGSGAFGVVWLAEKQTSIATTRFALKLSGDEGVDLEALQAGSGHLDSGEGVRHLARGC